MNAEIKNLLKSLVDALENEEAQVCLRTPSGEFTVENANGRYTSLLKIRRKPEELSFKDSWEKTGELLDKLF